MQTFSKLFGRSTILSIHYYMFILIIYMGWWARSRSFLKKKKAIEYIGILLSLYIYIYILARSWWWRGSLRRNWQASHSSQLAHPCRWMATNKRRRSLLYSAQFSSFYVTDSWKLGSKRVREAYFNSTYTTFSIYVNACCKYIYIYLTYYLYSFIYIHILQSLYTI